MRHFTPHIRRWLLGTTSIGIVVVAWYLMTSFRITSPALLPGPIRIVNVFEQLLTQGFRGVPLLQNVLVTLQRVFVALGWAIIIGIPLGIAMGMSKTVHATFRVLVNFYRPIPPLGYFVLLILWFGIGDPAKIALLFLVSLPMITVATMEGVRNTSSLKMNAARSLGATRVGIFFLVILPNALPFAFTGARLAVGTAYSTVVAAELISSNDGLGWMILSASRFLQTDVVVVGIILLAILGLLLDRCFRFLQSRTVHWEGKE